MSAYSLSVCYIVSMSVFTCQNGLLFFLLSSFLSVLSCRFTLAGNAQGLGDGGHRNSALQTNCARPLLPSPCCAFVHVSSDNLNRKICSYVQIRSYSQMLFLASCVSCLTKPRTAEKNDAQQLNIRTFPFKKCAKPATAPWIAELSDFAFSQLIKRGLNLAYVLVAHMSVYHSCPQTLVPKEFLYR